MFMKWPLFGTHHSTPAKLQFPPGTRTLALVPVRRFRPLWVAPICWWWSWFEASWSIEKSSLKPVNRQHDHLWRNNNIHLGVFVGYFFQIKNMVYHLLGNLMPESPPPENERMFPEMIPCLKGKFIFQPPIIIGYVSFSKGYQWKYGIPFFPHKYRPWWNSKLNI